MKQYLAVLCLCDEVLVERGLWGGFCEKLPPFSKEPMPSDSRIDLLLAKAEPIKDGSTFGVTDLTRGKKLSWKRSLDRGMRTCKGNSPANSKDGKEEGRRDSPDAGVEIPLQPILQTTVQQVFSLKPMEDHEDVEIHMQPMENPMVYQVSARRRL